MYFFRIHVTLFFVITPLSISPHEGKRFFILSPLQNVFLYLPTWGKARMGVSTLENCNQNSFILLVTLIVRCYIAIGTQDFLCVTMFNLCKFLKNISCLNYNCYLNLLKNSKLLLGQRSEIK